MLPLLAWVATVSVLAAYWRLGRTGNALPYHRVNVAGAVVLGAFNASLGAWPSVVLNVAYGLIALAALVRPAK